ncbi:hypothetical protein I7I50_06302 [Histoplasma capsulatum G186AR]|uniref:Uncharacterized protein n=1 Tax=Ajellomyces capsulatus TaxID=5037 RepID=A0A8H8D424_AJECA|nr:hypothetical protein I7I52_10625 [Histoplasma capsulatum]QSS67279.1 hypothetical protein I7I50_06302 [Histoplasma capsulatum G186AR]
MGSGFLGWKNALFLLSGSSSQNRPFDSTTYLSQATGTTLTRLSLLAFSMALEILSFAFVTSLLNVLRRSFVNFRLPTPPGVTGPR